MWWIEVLPPAVIMTTCIACVGFVNVGFQKLANNGKLRRKVQTPFDWHLLERDRRISGRFYEWNVKGLEALKQDSK